jgi:hypothetical protein
MAATHQLCRSNRSGYLTSDTMGCTRPAKPAGLISASLPSQPSLLAVIPAQAGIQCLKNKTLHHKNALRKTFLFRWIPACAGMTGTVVILSEAKDLLLHMNVIAIKIQIKDVGCQ